MSDGGDNYDVAAFVRTWSFMENFGCIVHGLTTAATVNAEGAGESVRIHWTGM